MKQKAAGALGQEREQGVQSGPLLQSRVLKMGAVQAESWGSGVVVGAIVVLTGCKASGNCNGGKMVDPDEVMPFPASCLALRGKGASRVFLAAGDRHTDTPALLICSPSVYNKSVLLKGVLGFDSQCSMLKVRWEDFALTLLQCLAKLGLNFSCRGCDVCMCVHTGVHVERL